MPEYEPIRSGHKTTVRIDMGECPALIVQDVHAGEIGFRLLQLGEHTANELQVLADSLDVAATDLHSVVDMMKEDNDD